MKTIPVIEVEQSQMQPLEVEPQRKLVEEEVRSIEQEVGAKPHVAIQNESTKATIEQLEAQDVVQ